jgi:hypothetical protein
MIRFDGYTFARLMETFVASLTSSVRNWWARCSASACAPFNEPKADADDNRPGRVSIPSVYTVPAHSTPAKNPTPKRKLSAAALKFEGGARMAQLVATPEKETPNSLDTRRKLSVDTSPFEGAPPAQLKTPPPKKSIQELL